MDLLLDADTHDLAITVGDLQITADDQSIRQSLKQRLLLFFGEWFLDTEKGVPYYQFILVKNPNLDVVQALLKDAVLGTPGVLELTAFEFDYAPGNRELTVALQGKSTAGDINFELPVGV